MTGPPQTAMSLEGCLGVNVPCYLLHDTFHTAVAIDGEHRMLRVRTAVDDVELLEFDGTWGVLTISTRHGWDAKLRVHRKHLNALGIDCPANMLHVADAAIDEVAPLRRSIPMQKAARYICGAVALAFIVLVFHNGLSAASSKTSQPTTPATVSAPAQASETASQPSSDESDGASASETSTAGQADDGRDQMNEITYNMADQFTHRCENSIEAQDYAGASVFCADAAEHWGDLADSTTGRVHEFANLSKAQMLSCEGGAKIAVARSEAGSYASRDREDGIQLMTDVLSDAKAMSRYASDASVRKAAADLVAEVSNEMNRLNT